MVSINILIKSDIKILKINNRASIQIDHKRYAGIIVQIEQGLD